MELLLIYTSVTGRKNLAPWAKSIPQWDACTAGGLRELSCALRHGSLTGESPAAHLSECNFGNIQLVLRE